MLTLATTLPFSAVWIVMPESMTATPMPCPVTPGMPPMPSNPPDPAQVVAGQLIGELRQVGTFDPTLFNEVRQNAAPPLGAAGFVPPSVLSIHAFRGTFFHGGIAPSLDAVMNNVTHRSAGTGGVDTLTNPADRAKIVRFLLSIDAGTVPIAQ